MEHQVALPGVAPPGHLPSLLVADDDPRIAPAIQDMLAERYRVVAASDGEQALEISREMRAAVAILGVRMPRLSGLCVAWALKNHPRHAGVPIVLMRSPEPEDPLVELRDTDAVWVRELADGYLLKPFTREELLAVLRAVDAVSSSGTPIPTDDRRLTPRLPVHVRGELHLRGRLAETTILSLSPRGAFVESELDLHPGAAASLRFELASGTFESGCQVLYRGNEQGGRGFGLRFHEVSPQSQAVLVRVLAGRSAAAV